MTANNESHLSYNGNCELDVSFWGLNCYYCLFNVKMGKTQDQIQSDTSLEKQL